jgi:hypothetical protein
MLIIGDDDIPCDEFYTIDSIEGIGSSKPNSIIYTRYDKKILHYCLVQDVSVAVKIENITQALLCNALKAKYLICETLELARSVQKLAVEYIFDSRVILIIEAEAQIENAAAAHIDGIIYEKALS